VPIAGHVGMLVALQPYVDSAISKTIHVPPDCDFPTCAAVFDQSYTAGLKGCTAFRPIPGMDAVLCPAPSCARD